MRQCWQRRLAAVAAVAATALAAGSPIGRQEVVRDAFTTTAHEVTELRRAGAVPVCRLQVAVWEPERPDAARFPARVRAGVTGASGGERWLDIRAWDELAPVVSDRLRLCREKGFTVANLGHRWGDPAGAGLTAADWDRFRAQVLTLAARHGLEVRAPGGPAARFTGAGEAGSGGRSTTSGWRRAPAGSPPRTGGTAALRTRRRPATVRTTRSRR